MRVARLQQDVNHVKAVLAALLELNVDPQRVRPCAELAGRCFVVFPPEVHEAEIVPRAIVGDLFFKDPPGDRCELPIDSIGMARRNAIVQVDRREVYSVINEDAEGARCRYSTVEVWILVGSVGLHAFGQCRKGNSTTGENLGISQPDTDGDKPAAYR